MHLAKDPTLDIDMERENRLSQRQQFPAGTVEQGFGGQPFLFKQTVMFELNH
jgi:hypothetical protein